MGIARGYRYCQYDELTLLCGKVLMVRADAITCGYRIGALLIINKTTLPSEC